VPSSSVIVNGDFESNILGWSAVEGIGTAQWDKLDADGSSTSGSIFLVKGSDEIAKLRLLLVEKKARGLGVGRALVEQCVRFAREARYRKITLWTQSILVAARGIYLKAGFKRLATEGHKSFGVNLIGETWEMTL